MFESSLVLRFFSSIYQFIIISFNESKTGRVLSQIFNGIIVGVKHSRIYSFRRIPYIMNDYWKNSRIFAIYCFLIQFPSNLFSKLYKKCENPLANSVIFRVFDKMLDLLHMFIGALLFIMIIVPFDYWNNRYALLGNIGLLLLLFMKTIVKKDTKFETRMTSLSGFLFGTSILMSFATSIYPMLSLRFLIFYINAFILVILLASEINTMKKFRELLNILVVSVTFTGLYGLWQWINGIPISQSQVDVTIESNLVGRVYSTIGNPNNYAELLVLTLPFFAALFFNAKTIKAKIYYGILALPCIVSLLLTYSRSSWIGLCVVIFVFVLFKNWRLIPIFGVLGLIAFPFLPASISNRILTIFTGDSSSNMRFLIWEQIIPMIKDFWVTGIGLGPDIFIKVMQRYPMLKKAVHAHNIFLQIWIETGIIGLFSFIGIQIYLLKESIYMIKEKDNKTTNNYIIAAISAIMGFLTIGLVEYVWHDHRVMLFYFMVVGLLMALLRNAKEN